MIAIRQPLCFSEIGRKDNQEDFLFPPSPDTSDRVFVLCDGMGGHDNGEVASSTAGTALGRGLRQAMAQNGTVNANLFESVLASAYDALDAVDTYSDKKPGTTMTALCLNPDNVLAAHIGDSRIYHIRPSLYKPAEGRGGILYQSQDHSLVNDLLRAGEIDEMQAATFPGRNIITRAMQPNSTRSRADVFTFTDVRAGDYFFMCCDGVLEQLTNSRLCEILADPNADDAQKLAQIKAVCDGRTRDNYTCWLIPVQNADIKPCDDADNVITADLVEPAPAVRDTSAPAAAPKPTPMPAKTAPPRTSASAGKRTILPWIIAIMVLLLGSAATMWYLYGSDKDNTEKKSSPKKAKKSRDLYKN